MQKLWNRQWKKEDTQSVLSQVGKISQSSNSDRSTPHARRIQQVFLALDEASAEGVTTYVALVDFVRIKTGKGCSKKLIAKWKREHAVQSTNVNVSPTSLEQPPTTSSPLTVTVQQFPKPITFPKLRHGRLPQFHQLFSAAIMGLGLALGGGQLLNADQAVPPGEVLLSQNVPTPSPSSPPPSDRSAPRLLKLNLKISSPKDVKVRQGDTVVAGEVLADRVEERSRLTATLQSLDLEYKQVATRTVPTPPPPVQVPPVRALPPVSYEEEETAIFLSGMNIRQAERAFQQHTLKLQTPPIEESAALRRAAVEVKNEERIVNNQKRKIDAVAVLKDLPDAVMPHEQEVLKQKEASLLQVQADYEQAQARLDAASQAQNEKLQQLGVALEKARADRRVAISKLQTKKDARAYTEYEASVTAAQRAEQNNFTAISRLQQLQGIAQQQRDRDYQLAQLQNKITEVKEQLSLVSVVTSPYSGVIKSVKVQRQTNNSLSVEITIAVGDGTSVPGASTSPDTASASN